MRNAVMAIAFQLGWFACVLSGARGWPLTALASAAIVMACNLGLKRRDIRRELALAAGVTLVGLAVETVNLASGVFTLTHPSVHPWLCPVWLALLWTQFATLLRGPFSWLAGRYALSALLGALFASPNYFAGARLGAVSMNSDTTFSIAVLVALWAAAMPILVWLAKRADT